MVVHKYKSSWFLHMYYYYSGFISLICSNFQLLFGLLKLYLQTKVLLTLPFQFLYLTDTDFLTEIVCLCGCVHSHICLGHSDSFYLTLIFGNLFDTTLWFTHRQKGRRKRTEFISKKKTDADVSVIRTLWHCLKNDTFLEWGGEIHIKEQWLGK